MHNALFPERTAVVLIINPTQQPCHRPLPRTPGAPGRLRQVRGVICARMKGSQLGGPSKVKQVVSGGGIPSGSGRFQSPLPPLHATLQFSGTAGTGAQQHSLLPVCTKRQRPHDHPGCGHRQQEHVCTGASTMGPCPGSTPAKPFYRSIAGAQRGRCPVRFRCRAGRVRPPCRPAGQRWGFLQTCSSSCLNGL